MKIDFLKKTNIFHYFPSKNLKYSQIFLSETIHAQENGSRGPHFAKSLNSNFLKGLTYSAMDHGRLRWAIWTPFQCATWDLHAAKGRTRATCWRRLNSSFPHLKKKLITEVNLHFKLYRTNSLSRMKYWLTVTSKKTGAMIIGEFQAPLTYADKLAHCTRLLKMISKFSGGFPWIFSKAKASRRKARGISVGNHSLRSTISDNLIQSRNPRWGFKKMHDRQLNLWNKRERIKNTP